MKHILLVQLDGKLPNIALMRLSAHHKAQGDQVELRFGASFEVALWDQPFDVVYGSAIFEKSRPLAERLLAVYPGAIIGGTGWAVDSSLESIGIESLDQDYTIYPKFRQSIGFTQRGCRLKCSFCVVPRKEGRIREEQTIHDVWRGDPWPRELVLLDNDFFGQPNWKARIAEIRDGGFKVSFNQGINARCITEEAAEAIGSIDYRNDSMDVKRIYTAWDSREDEDRLFAGLNRLVKYGVKPDQIMVYILVGYWPGETHEGRDYRRMKLREFGCRPYPMPYTRTQELVGFQRWVIGAYDKRIGWKEWYAANFRPEKLGRESESVAMFPVLA